MAKQDDQIRVHAFDQGSMTLDARRFPVVVTNSTGQVGRAGAEALCRFMDEMVERACREGVRLVSISDATRAARPSRGDIRYIMEQADAREQRAPGRVLAGLVIVESPLMRGMVALALWLSKQPIEMFTVPTFKAAAGRARELLEAAGVGVPDDLETFIGRLEHAQAS